MNNITIKIIAQNNIEIYDTDYTTRINDYLFKAPLPINPKASSIRVYIDDMPYTSNYSIYGVDKIKFYEPISEESLVSIQYTVVDLLEIGVISLNINTEVNKVDGNTTKTIKEGIDRQFKGKRKTTFDIEVFEYDDNWDNVFSLRKRLDEMGDIPFYIEIDHFSDGRYIEKAWAMNESNNRTIDTETNKITLTFSAITILDDNFDY